MVKLNREFVVATCIILILLIPALNIKFFWLDDGVSLMNGYELIQGIKSFDINKVTTVVMEENLGRFRPTYWAWQAISISVAGKNPTIHYIIHFVLILASGFLLNKIISTLTNSATIGLLSTVMFLVNPLTSENLYRLGPQEPLMGLLLIAFMYCFLIKKSRFLPSFFLILFLFSKETSLAIFPGMVVLYLGKIFSIKKRDLIHERYLLFILLSSLLIFLTISQFQNTYSSYYDFNIARFLEHLTELLKITNKSFEIFFLVLTTSFFLREGYLLYKKKSQWFNGQLFLQRAIFIIFISFLIVLAPWQFPLERYLMVAAIPLIIFMSIELKQASLLFKDHKLTLGGSKIFLLTFSMVYVFINLINNFYLGERFVYYTKHVDKMIGYVSTKAPLNSSVLLNFKQGSNTVEYVLETDLHLKLLHNRKDINVSYLDLRHLPFKSTIAVSGSFVPVQYTDKIITEQFNDKPIRLESNGSIFIVTTPLNFLKQMTKNLVQYIVFQKQFTTEGIYAISYLNDYWDIFQIN